MIPKWKRGSLVHWSSMQVKREWNGWPQFCLTYSPLRSIGSSSPASGIWSSSWEICACFLRQPHRLRGCCFLVSKIICGNFIHNECLNRLFLLSRWIRGDATAAILEPRFKFRWAPPATMGEGVKSTTPSAVTFLLKPAGWTDRKKLRVRVAKKGWTLNADEAVLKNLSKELAAEH